MDFTQIDGARLIDFNKGEYLIQQGEKVEYVYYLLTGSCYRSLICGNGDELVFTIKTSSKGVKSILGALSAFTEGGTTMYSFIVKETGRGYKIPMEAFKKAIVDKPETLAELIELSVAELRKVSTSFQSKSQGKLDSQVAKILLKYAINQDDKWVVSRECTNDEIARFTGTHKVSVCRIIKKFKEQEIVERKGRQLIIKDPDLLREYVDGV